MKPERFADELLRSIDSAHVKLNRITEEEAARPRAPGKWSRKEVLGHLIDSAANNHQRFVRAQQGEELTFPSYAQDAWVRIQNYRSCSWTALLEHWRAYNRHLAWIVRCMPSSVLEVPCRIGEADAVSLGALVEDYMRHLRHHLGQLEGSAG